MASASRFAGGSSFVDLRRPDPTSIDWASIDTIGEAASTIDYLSLPTVHANGRPAYDYQALDSGEAEAASTELVRRGLLNPAEASLVLPALTDGATREQRRMHEYARERAAYSAGKRVQVLAAVDAAQAAFGGGEPTPRGEATYARVARVAGEPRPSDDGPEVPFFRLLFGNDPYNADSLYAVGVPTSALIAGGYGYPSEAEINYQKRQTIPNPFDYLAVLFAPVLETALIAGVYAAAGALLGPIGIGLALQARRNSLQGDARLARERALAAQTQRQAQQAADRYSLRQVVMPGDGLG